MLVKVKPYVLEEHTAGWWKLWADDDVRRVLRTNDVVDRWEAWSKGSDLIQFNPRYENTEAYLRAKLDFLTGQSPENPDGKPDYWDDADNDMNFLSDSDGNDVYEGVTVYTPNGFTILRDLGNVDYEAGTRFVVERINVEDGMLLVRPEDGWMKHEVNILYFRRVNEDTKPLNHDALDGENDRQQYETGLTDEEVQDLRAAEQQLPTQDEVQEDASDAG